MKSQRSWGELLGGVPKTAPADRNDADGENVEEFWKHDPARIAKRIRELRRELKQVETDYHDKINLIRSHLHEEQDKWLRLTSELMPEVVPPKIEMEGEDE